MSRSWRRALLLALALGVLAARPVLAQDLRPALQRVASSWHKGDAAAVSRLAADGGISLDVDGSTVGPLGARQAAAVLRRVFDDRESISAAPKVSRTIGGDPARAFGEITWTTRARGTTIPERATLFVAFVREGDAWRITEIRLMR
ncbi:MAG TPA: DUF4440 domain-containing protein [Longimicrobiales bacterium]|nr:DUF4440 domain-containing protein [Longimicrobiales bacterium]